eukprot:Lankesteria_metandrocarpae@DN5036_c0_g1_i2.p1
MELKCLMSVLAIYSCVACVPPEEETNEILSKKVPHIHAITRIELDKAAELRARFKQYFSSLEKLNAAETLVDFHKKARVHAPKRSYSNAQQQNYAIMHDTYN